MCWTLCFVLAVENGNNVVFLRKVNTEPKHTHTHKTHNYTRGYTWMVNVPLAASVCRWISIWAVSPPAVTSLWRSFSRASLPLEISSLMNTCREERESANQSGEEKVEFINWNGGMDKWWTLIPLSLNTRTWQRCPGVSSSQPEIHVWRSCLRGWRLEHHSDYLKSTKWWLASCYNVCSCYGTLYSLCITDDGVQRLLFRLLLHLLCAVVRLLAEAEAGPLGAPRCGPTAPPLLLENLRAWWQEEVQKVYVRVMVSVLVFNISVVYRRLTLVNTDKLNRILRQKGR